MRIESLEIQNFRNIERAELCPAAGINIIYGKNAQGKTNLLEAILLCLSGRSPRENIRANFIGKASDRAQVRLLLSLEDEPNGSLCMEIDGSSRRYRLDDEPVRSRAELLSRFPVVFFGPDDTELIRSASALRRAFMDETIISLYPSYSPQLSRHNALLRQRNVLLRARHPDMKMLSVYDEQLSVLGCALMRARVRFLKEFEKFFAQLYAEVGEGEKLGINYVSPLFSSGTQIEPERYQKMLAASRENDLRLGYSTAGIQRDDILVLLDERPARKFASQGQSRSLALCMKLALLPLYSEHSRAKPIVLLDDVGSELDEWRRARILTLLSGGVQSFLSCTEDVGIEANQAAHFSVSAGTVTKQ